MEAYKLAGYVARKIGYLLNFPCLSLPPFSMGGMVPPCAARFPVKALNSLALRLGKNPLWGGNFLVFDRPNRLKLQSVSRSFGTRFLGDFFSGHAEFWLCAFAPGCGQPDEIQCG